MRKTVIGIPVLVNEHTEALELCLASIKKYANIDVEICLLLHWDTSFSDDIDILPLLARYSPLKCYLYRESRNYMFKQILIDLIRHDYPDYDYMIIMHSDVFLWRENALSALLKPYESGEYISTFRSVPLHLYRSTFHLREQKKLLIAPRISTWFFSLNIPYFNRVIEQYQHCFRYPLFNGRTKFNTEDNNEFIEWAKKSPDYEMFAAETGQVLFDVGCFFYYYMQKLGIPYYDFGTDVNPDFKSVKPVYREEGIVHLEQFDPRRFDNQFYSVNLFNERIKLVRELMREYE